MTLATGSTVLRGRYELIGEGKPVAGEALLWRGIDDDGVHQLIKIWSYDGDEPDPVRRALWDAELRTLYKLGSSPGADESLVVLRDAGVDRSSKCFVMVLQSPGSANVAGALTERQRHSWLASRDPRGRAEIWAVVERVASGLALLHEQQVLHRDVGAEALIFDDQGGPESVRLGGFEWSVRLGRPLDADPPSGWSSPPERVDGEQRAWRPDDDWFGFGVLCARLLLDLEHHKAHAPLARHLYVVSAIAKATNALTENERLLLSKLIAIDPLERISRAEDVLAGIRQIRRQLSSPAAEREDNRPFTLVINPRAESLVDHLVGIGLREHLRLSGTTAFNPTDPSHTSGRD